MKVRLFVLPALVAGLLTAPAAHAQFTTSGPGGIILSSVNLGQGQVTTPTGSAQNLLSLSPGIPTSAFSNPVSFHGEGTIDGQVSSPGTLTLTVKLGTATTETVVSAVTIETGVGANPSIPFQLDCRWTQVNTGTTAVGLTTALTQSCWLRWMPASGTGDKVFAPTKSTTPNITIALTPSQTLVIAVTMSSTAAGTGITMRDWRIANTL